MCIAVLVYSDEVDAQSWGMALLGSFYSLSQV